MIQFTLVRRLFVIRFWPALACLAVMAVTLGAAQWQTARARYKQGLVDGYALLQKQPVLDLSAWGEMPPPEFSRALVSGEWRADVLIYGDNQVRDGQAGYAIFMPLCQTADRCVLVDRGWAKQGANRETLPRVATPRERVAVAGVVARAQPRFVELSADAIQGKVWQNVTVDRVARATGLRLAPFILTQTSASDDGLRRSEVRPDFGVEKHIIYAVQWYAFALVTAVSGLFAAMRKTGEKS